MKVSKGVIQFNGMVKGALTRPVQAQHNQCAALTKAGNRTCIWGKEEVYTGF